MKSFSIIWIVLLLCYTSSGQANLDTNKAKADFEYYYQQRANTPHTPHPTVYKVRETKDTIFLYCAFEHCCDWFACPYYRARVFNPIEDYHKSEDAYHDYLYDYIHFYHPELDVDSVELKVHRFLDTFKFTNL